MTPFDPVALVVMLTTFYPLVTRASLERAFRERPDYFAGGTLIGRNGEVLKLQDGRLFDLAFSAWAANARWQALDVTHSEGGGGDPFGLEDGPLVPIDVDGIPPPVREAAFESLLGGALVTVGASELQLEAAARDLAPGDRAAALDSVYADTVGQSAVALEGDKQALEFLNTTELLEQSDGLTGETRDRQQDFPGDPYAPPAPDVEAPERPPRDDDAGGPGRLPEQ